MKKVVLLTTQIIAALFFYLLVQTILIELPLPRWVQMFFPSAFVAVLIMLFLYHRGKTIALGLKQRDPWKHLHNGIWIGIGLIMASFLLIWLSQTIQVQDVQSTQTIWLYFLLMTGAFFIVSFHEEVFFRGYIYGIANHYYNPKAALWISSILFAFMHASNPNALANPLPLLNICLAGFFLGLLREVTQGLWAPIGFHWSWNLVQGNILGFHVSGLPMEAFLQLKINGMPLLSGGKFGAEGSIITTLILFVSIWYTYKKRSTA